MKWSELPEKKIVKPLDYLMQVAIDSATPLDDAGPSDGFMMGAADPFGGYGGPMRTYGRMYGSLDFDDVSMLGSIP